MILIVLSPIPSGLAAISQALKSARDQGLIRFPAAENTLKPSDIVGFLPWRTGLITKDMSSTHLSFI